MFPFQRNYRGNGEKILEQYKTKIQQGKDQIVHYKSGM